MFDASQIGLIGITASVRAQGGLHWSVVVPISRTNAIQYQTAHLTENMWGFRVDEVNPMLSLNLAAIVFIGNNLQGLYSIHLICLVQVTSAMETWFSSRIFWI